MTVDSINIFSVSAAPYVPEDRFTAHLAYLFGNIPALGQAWLDHLLARAGAEPDAFEGAAKHAEGTAADQPDFLIIGERVDVICEHKLGAPLGERQLERYLAFARGRARGRSRPTRLALVSGAVSPVPPEVLDAPEYLRPQNSALAHFRWEELYPLVAAREERLAREFAAYMAHDLGLRPSDTREWADLFTSRGRIEDFLPQWADAIADFRALGATTVTRSNSLGLEVRNAVPWLRLLYLTPLERLDDPTTALLGPYVRAGISLDAADPRRSAFCAPASFLAGTPFPVYSRPMAQRGAPWDATLVGVREYLAPLDAVLSSEPWTMRRQLHAFARVAFDSAATVYASGVAPGSPAEVE